MTEKLKNVNMYYFIAGKKALRSKALESAKG